MNLNWEAKGIDIGRVSGGKTFCPACHATRKHKSDRSLSVDLQTGLFNCHNSGCGFSGSVVERDSPLAVSKAARVYTKPEPRLQKVSDKALAWFEGRGISNNTLLRFKVTSSKEWMPGDESGKKSSVLCFNYFRDADCSELVNIKHRSGDKRFRMEKGAELIFYNLSACQLGKEVVIVEGEIDALTLWECGIHNVVSVPNGASLSANAKLEYLDNCWREFEHLERIILATDDDDAGRALSAELTRRLGAARCYTVSYPTEEVIRDEKTGEMRACKDANEVLVKHGRDAVVELVKTAAPIPLEGVATVDDEMEGLITLYEHGYPQGCKLDWEELDELLRLRTGLLVTITGTPGSGKSTWLNNVLVRLARLHNWRTGIFSPEKMPLSFLIAELASILTGKPYYRADATLKMSPEEWRKALSYLLEYFYFLRLGEVDATLSGLLQKAEECVKRYGIKAFVIDPWNYLEHQRTDGLTETEYVSKALSEISGWCKRLGVTVFLIAHPTKIPRDMGTGQLQVPNLYSISGSANFYNKTDIGITVYRDGKKGVTEIHVQKVRWFFDGKIGIAKLFYQPQNQQFLDTPPAIPLEDAMAGIAAAAVPIELDYPDSHATMRSAFRSKVATNHDEDDDDSIPPF